MTKSITLERTRDQSVSKILFTKYYKGGNQYTYQGNTFQKLSANVKAVEEAINTTILNQELGKSPMEYTNQLSRAKVYEMKRLTVPDNIRSYNNLYQE
jgi:hypothetical protein